MSARIDLLGRLESALTDASTILRTMSPEARTQALAEAQSQGISVVLLVAREISVIARDAEIEALKRLNVNGACAAPLSVEIGMNPRSGASLDRSPGASSPKDGSGRRADTRGNASERTPTPRTSIVTSPLQRLFGHRPSVIDICGKYRTYPPCNTA
jgi:hypothetical protein